MVALDHGAALRTAATDADAAASSQLVAEGWRTGRHGSTWAIEAERDGTPAVLRHIDLRLRRDGLAEIGFGLHPAARGRVADERGGPAGPRPRLRRRSGWTLIRWRARVGNWPSRRVAAAAGFVFDGTVRRLLVERGELARRLGGHDHRRRPADAAAAGCDPAELGAADGVRLRPVPGRRRRSGSSRPARTRGPATGWSRCPARTSRPSAYALSGRRPGTGRPAAPVWPGASTDPTTTAAWARSAWRDWAATTSAARSATGPTRRPAAAGVITEAVRLVTA